MNYIMTHFYSVDITAVIQVIDDWRPPWNKRTMHCGILPRQVPEGMDEKTARSLRRQSLKMLHPDRNKSKGASRAWSSAKRAYGNLVAKMTKGLQSLSLG